MATVFETRLIGNLGKDAMVRSLEGQVVAINFPVAHNQNWKDKRTGHSKTKTTWVNCTIWKQEGANLKILDFLKKGTLVEIIGTPVAKAYKVEDGSIRSEIRLTVIKTNILRTVSKEEFSDSDNNSLEDVFSDDL
tara:strand:- start:808 stop:1212 length:405 start_codon:yes stop_codon:yes gene_type:complete